MDGELLTKKKEQTLCVRVGEVGFSWENIKQSEKGPTQVSYF